MNVKPERVQLSDLNVETNRQDYGCIIVCDKNITHDTLADIANNVDNVIHFAKSSSSATRLQDNFSKSTKTKFLSALLLKKSKLEYLQKSSATVETKTENKKIFISYWGSSLSIGTNMPHINICSVDNKLSIPFLFIPLNNKINTNSLLMDYIENYIIENIIQMFARINRGHGNQFKILILNRTKNEKQKDNSFISKILNNENFALKFKNFKVFKNFNLRSENSLRIMKNWMTENKPLILNQ